MFSHAVQHNRTHWEFALIKNPEKKSLLHKVRGKARKIKRAVVKRPHGDDGQHDRDLSPSDDGSEEPAIHDAPILMFFICAQVLWTLSKRSIHELLNQIDPSENLDPEVEDILVDIADDFVESITTFGCSLAKHRKSSTLEAKDILLHLERNWNLTLPGFSGDEIKTYKKPISNDIHKERLAAIKKSLVGNEMTNTKPSGGQAAQKGHLVKAPANTMES